MNVNPNIQTKKLNNKKIEEEEEEGGGEGLRMKRIRKS